jgi:CRP/FNR family transcriptional regulator
VVNVQNKLKKDNSQNYTGGFFDKLSPEALQDLESTHPARLYPADTALFEETYPTGGVFLVVDGMVRLTVSSINGRRLRLRLARKGAILGLAATLSDNVYDATARTLVPANIIHILERDFLSFMDRHREAYQAVLEEFSCNLLEARRQLRTIGLAVKTPEKLASLLLDISEGGQVTESGGTKFRLSMTHEEIGEFLGTSRETVTRNLSKLKTLRLLDVKGSVMTIANRAAFANYALRCGEADAA